MSDAKVYVGNAKVIKTQFGELTKMSLTAEDVEKLQQNLDNGWINVVIKERREPSASGFTHYLEVDTWKPNTTEEGGGGTAPAEAKKPAPESGNVAEMAPEDLPF